MAVRERITGMFSRGRRVSEIIGRVAVTTLRILGARKTVDETNPDYAFWDEFRHGKKAGYELSSLLAKPATEIMASWVGTPDKVTVSETPPPSDPTPGPSPLHREGDSAYTNELLKRFMGRVRGTLERLFVDLFGLGEQFIVINPDGSISIPSPDTVDPEHDPVDYRKLVKVTIRTKLDGVDVTDQYRLDGRTITIKNTGREPLETAFGVVPARETLTAEFENLIGRLPVVHFANDRGVNETRGRPMYAALITLFGWYNDLLVRALKGANRLSNPVLALFKLSDVDQVQEDNSHDIGETYQDEDGSIRNRDRLAIDDEDPVLLLGEGADAKYVSPGTGFTTDIRNMLKSLYLLFMEHLHLPDVVMGFELSSARASAAEQIKTFFAHIRGRRTQLEGEGTDDLLMVEARGGLMAVIDIWLRMKQLTDPKVVVGPVTMTWPELDEADETMRFNWVKYLYDQGILTDETLAQLSGHVEDVEGEIARAREQQADAREPWQQEADDAETDEGELMDEAA